MLLLEEEPMGWATLEPELREVDPVPTWSFLDLAAELRELAVPELRELEPVVT